MRLRPVRILLVEDSSADVYLLEKTLQQRQVAYELLSYEDGDQAIAALAREDWLAPDLILLDVNLPGSGGFEVLQAIRGTPRLVGVPIEIFTSSDAARDRHRMNLLGAERYIHKPPTLDEFLDQVGQAITEMLKR